MTHQEINKIIFAETPSKEAIQRATYILNHYSRDSYADTLCLALALDRHDQKLKEWEKCADCLYVYAEEIQCTVTNNALYQAVCDDIAEYKRLKSEVEEQ